MPKNAIEPVSSRVSPSFRCATSCETNWSLPLLLYMQVFSGLEWGNGSKDLRVIFAVQSVQCFIVLSGNQLEPRYNNFPKLEMLRRSRWHSEWTVIRATRVPTNSHSTLLHCTPATWRDDQETEDLSADSSKDPQQVVKESTSPSSDF